MASALFCAGVYSQELDTLMHIMQNEKGVRGQETISYKPDAAVPQKEYEVRASYAVQDIWEIPAEKEESVYFEIDEDEYNNEYEADEYENKYEYNVNDDDPDEGSRISKFKGHWAGAELGLNNFFDDDFSVSRGGEAWFMDINTARSWVFNLNFTQYSLGIVPGYAGIVTGMGLEFNNYFFDNDISINENADEIQVIDLAGTNIVRSKLATIFLRVPILFEIQIPGSGGSDKAFIAAGLTGSLKLDAHTKVIYKEGDNKTKDKNWEDFNINPFRYGITARLGYGNTNIFFDYDISTFFSEGKGPELYPFSIGLSATF